MILIGPTVDVITHNSSMAVYSYSLDTNSLTCLLQQQNNRTEDGFCGIANPIVQEVPFSEDGEYPANF